MSMIYIRAQIGIKMNKLTKTKTIELINIKDDYKRAYLLVSYLFANKKDKEKEPYINHLLRVSNKLKKEETKIAGLLHDTVEDTKVTFKDLKSLGFNDNIITLVKLVTNKKTFLPKTKRKRQEIYHNKITSIIESNNIEAIKLKYSDMSDNFNQERLNKLDNKTKEYLINKYQPEIIRLENYLKERGEEI